MDLNTLVWSVVLFCGGYAGTMATSTATGWFSWPALAAGFSAVISFHEGKNQIISNPVNKVVGAIKQRFTA